MSIETEDRQVGRADACVSRGRELSGVRERIDPVVYASSTAGVPRHRLNDEVYIHQSRLNDKAGLRGTAFYWRSDLETWCVEHTSSRCRDD